MRVVLVLGTRPQIIKSAPLIDLALRDGEVELGIVHTGQHYDYEMSRAFFEELSLPEPEANLDVRSGSHGIQTGIMMIRLDRFLARNPPRLVVVPGDTNSALAGALTAAKRRIPVAHVEAGARSFDMSMPEEVNRRVADHCSSLLFTPTDRCTDNLIREGIDEGLIHQVGDTMYDALLMQLPHLEESKILERERLTPRRYVLLTVHRAENVDNLTRLRDIMGAAVSLEETVALPVHPRTRRRLAFLKVTKHPRLRLMSPVGYRDSLRLIRDASIVMTDSGGVQKEAFWLGTPCITLRETTEWPETVEAKMNHLTGANLLKTVKTAQALLQNTRRIIPADNPFGDGGASRRILEILKHEGSRSR